MTVVWKCGRFLATSVPVADCRLIWRTNANSKQIHLLYRAKFLVSSRYAVGAPTAVDIAHICSSYLTYFCLSVFTEYLAAHQQLTAEHTGYSHARWTTGRDPEGRTSTAGSLQSEIGAELRQQRFVVDPKEDDAVRHLALLSWNGTRSQIAERRSLWRAPWPCSRGLLKPGYGTRRISSCSGMPCCRASRTKSARMSAWRCALPLWDILKTELRHPPLRAWDPWSCPRWEARDARRRRVPTGARIDCARPARCAARSRPRCYGR